MLIKGMIFIQMHPVKLVKLSPEWLVQWTFIGSNPPDDSATDSQ
jgi:hypothetical protein